MKKLIVSLVLIFSLTAMPVFADTEHSENDNYWKKCVDMFHVVYEEVFAPYDKEWIQYIYNKYGKPDRANITGFTNSEELKEIIENATGHVWAYPRIVFTDTFYLLTTIDELKRFLEFDDTNELVFRYQARDCDDFARLLRARVERWTPGLAFGYIHVHRGNHVVNIFVDADHNVWYVEPQTDSVRLIDSIDETTFIFLRKDENKDHPSGCLYD